MIENTQVSDVKKETAPLNPNESAGFAISTYLKITDPNTGQVLVQKRGDN